MKLFINNTFLFIIYLALVNVSVILDIPYLRQISGFFLLTFIPGLMLINVFGGSKLDFWNKYVLAIGISISFILFSGLFLNYFLLYIGYSRPLSAINLLISYDFLLIVLFLIYGKMSSFRNISLPIFNLTATEKMLLVIPILLPAISLVGMNELTQNSSNIIILSMLILISLYLITISFTEKGVPNRIYLPVILLISISLSILFELRCPHIMGMDRHTEYYMYKITLDNLYWGDLYHSNLDSCLSISLLPTIYQSFMNWNEEYLCKYIIPIIFSTTPLIIFIVSKRYIDDIYAFLAAFFLMSQHLFFYFTGGRTNLAIFFVALIIMVLFSDKLELIDKRIFLIIFLASCIVSHYATSYLLFFVFLIIAMIVRVLALKYNLDKNLSLYLILLFFVMMFFWYGMITEGPFSSAVIFIKTTIVSMTKHASGELLSSDVSSLLGSNLISKSIPSKIEFILTWLIFAFIGGGIFCMISWYLSPLYKNFLHNIYKNFSNGISVSNPIFVKLAPDVEFIIGSIIFSGMLFISLVIPYLSVGYDISRIFFVSIVFLAIFFVSFGLVISDVILIFFQSKLSNIMCITGLNGCNIRRTLAIVVLLLIIVPYFLSTTGVLYNIFGANRELIINSEKDFLKINEGMEKLTQFDLLFISERESNCGKWFHNKGNLSIETYADFFGRPRLVSQATTLNVDGYSLAEGNEKVNGYLFLDSFNMLENKLIDSYYKPHSICNYTYEFKHKNLVYSNGGSQIWL